MEKKIFCNLKTYFYNAEKKGAKFTFDGIHYMNNGEFIESQLKHCMGYGDKKDANTPFDMGSDIPEISCSVKSGKATLCNEILGNDFDSSLETYFARTASKMWAWGFIIDETLTVFLMNQKEFHDFTRNWAGYSSEQKIRYKAMSSKMLAWLEARV